MKRIVVTGCAGFIGSHLTERLLEAGFHVLGIDNFDPFYPRTQKEDNLRRAYGYDSFQLIEGNIADPETWQQIRETADMVIHLAAKAGVLPSLQDPLGYIQVNIVGTQNLLEWMLASGCRKLVFGSSSSVYGNTREIPFRENMDVSKPISNYAFTKVACEILIRTYYELHKIDAVNLRFFTVIGERQRPDLAVNKFVRMIRNNEPVTMYGDGSTARDYTYVGDIVSGILKAMDYVYRTTPVCETINLGNHSPINLLDMIHTIYKVLEKEPDIQRLPMQKGDVDITYASIEKAQALLGYEPTTTFEEGVRRFVKWSEGR